MTPPVEYRSRRTANQVQRVGAASGGAWLEPTASAGWPGMNRLQPLLPDTRSKKGCNSSSMHRPSVWSLALAPGSTCHHLQSLHRPHESLDALFAMAVSFGVFRPNCSPPGPESWEAGE